MVVLKPEFEHKDARRTLKQLLTADIKQINAYEAKRGAFLGNHYHKQTTEFFFIAKGTILYNDKQVFNRGAILQVSPEENHSLLCMTDVLLLSFLTKSYTESDPDIWKK